MPAVRQRSSSPEGRSAKKPKGEAASGITLPDGAKRNALREAYDVSTPYKHTVVPGLLSDELVRPRRPADSSSKL